MQNASAGRDSHGRAKPLKASSERRSFFAAPLRVLRGECPRSLHRGVRFVLAAAEAETAL